MTRKLSLLLSLSIAGALLAFGAPEASAYTHMNPWWQ